MLWNGTRIWRPTTKIIKGKTDPYPRVDNWRCRCSPPWARGIQDEALPGCRSVGRSDCTSPGFDGCVSFLCGKRNKWATARRDLCSDLYAASEILDSCKCRRGSMSITLSPWTEFEVCKTLDNFHPLLPSKAKHFLFRVNTSCAITLGLFWSRKAPHRIWIHWLFT